MGTVTKLQQILKAGYVIELRDGGVIAYLNDPEHPGLENSKSRMGSVVGELQYQIDQVWHLAFGYPEDEE